MPADPVETLLAPVLALGETDRAAEIDRLCSAHPEHAAALRARYSVAASLMNASERIEQVDPKTTIGGYELQDRLGGGGMGVVFAARQSKAGGERLVALKLIRHPAFLTKTGLERFRREARLAMGLDHPGLCPVLDYGEDGDTPYLAMRLIRGRSLAERIAAARDGAEATAPILSESSSGSRRPFAEATRLLELLARAAHFAHEAGLVHRDIKPGNVLVTDEGDPVLVDFGLARDIEDHDHLTLSNEPVGTPVYMPPEQVRGSRNIDRRADVYSLGATLFELLTLHAPFAAPSRELLYQKIARGETEPRTRDGARLPRDLDSIVRVAMDPDPRRRYATAAALADDLERYRVLEPIHARPAGLFLRLARWTQRNRSAAVALVTVSSALVISSFLLWSERQARDAARTNYHHARDAVLAMVEIARDDLTGMPHAGPARRKLLERAIQLQDRFLASSSSDDLQAERVEALYERGWMLATLGEQQGALDSLNAALERARALPATPKLLHLRAHAEHWRGHALGQLGDASAQVEACERSVALFEQIQSPTIEDRSKLSQALNRASMSLIQAGKFSQAVTVARRAVALAEAIPKESAYQPIRTFRLGQARARLGDALVWTGKVALATPEFEAALAHLESCARTRSARAELAWVRTRWAQQLERLRRVKDMVQEAERALASYRKLVDEYPGVLGYPLGAANAVELLARAAHRRGDMPTALDHYAETIAMRQRCFELAPGQTDSVVMLAYAHYGLARATQDRDPTKAIQSYQAGLAHLIPFHAEHPTSGGAARMLANMAHDVARLQWTAGQRDAALKNMDRAVRAFQGVTRVSTNNLDLRRRLARSLTTKGRWHQERQNPAAAASNRAAAHTHWEWITKQRGATVTDVVRLLETWPRGERERAQAWLDARPAKALAALRKDPRVQAALQALQQ